MHNIKDSDIDKDVKERGTQIAVRMLQQKLDFNLIASVTGLSTDDLLKLKHKTQIAS